MRIRLTLYFEGIHCQRKLIKIATFSALNYYGHVKCEWYISTVFPFA